MREKGKCIVDKAFNDLKHYDRKQLLYLMAGIPYLYLHQLSELCRHGKRTYYHNRYVDGVHPNGNLLAKWGNCFNKSIVEKYNETPCVSGKTTTIKFNKTISL